MNQHSSDFPASVSKQWSPNVQNPEESQSLFPFLLHRGSHYSPPCSTALCPHGCCPKAESESATPLFVVVPSTKPYMGGSLEKLDDGKKDNRLVSGAKPSDLYTCGKWQGCRCSVHLKCLWDGNMTSLSMKMFFSHGYVSEASPCLKHFSSIDCS